MILSGNSRYSEHEVPRLSGELRWEQIICEIGSKRVAFVFGELSEEEKDAVSQRIPAGTTIHYIDVPAFL
jgi:hypothetical protein